MSKEEWQSLKNSAPVRIQWDPERDLMLRPLPHGAIQIGAKQRGRTALREPMDFPDHSCNTMGSRDSRPDRN